MPITVFPARHLALNALSLGQPRLTTSSELLSHLPSQEIRTTAGQIFQSSFVDSCEGEDGPRAPCTTDLSEHAIFPSRRGNGLVDTVLDAYNGHHQLVLRADDIWTTILSQYSLYVNSHADEMRSFFVSHEGKKQLSIQAGGTRDTANFGDLAQQFTGLLGDRLVDKDLREWILPDFTTTTDNDRVTCSILMMATLREYFSFNIFLMCGLPAVTLEGEREDWVRLLNKLEKLESFGQELASWASLLRPVLRRFLATWDQPTSEEVLRFWNQIAHQQPTGSGAPELSGWITAFCAFDHEGRIKPITNPTAAASSLALDGIHYPTITIDSIPGAFITAPVRLVDHGYELSAEMVAGCLAMQASRGDAPPLPSADLTALRPVSGWAIYEKVLVKNEL